MLLNLNTNTLRDLTGENKPYFAPFFDMSESDFNKIETENSNTVFDLTIAKHFASYFPKVNPSVVSSSYTEQAANFVKIACGNFRQVYIDSAYNGKIVDYYTNSMWNANSTTNNMVKYGIIGSSSSTDAILPYLGYGTQSCKIVYLIRVFTDKTFSFGCVGLRCAGNNTTTLSKEIISNTEYISIASTVLAQTPSTPTTIISEQLTGRKFWRWRGYTD